MTPKLFLLGFITIWLAVLPAQARPTDSVTSKIAVFNQADEPVNEVEAWSQKDETTNSIFLPYLEQIQHNLPSDLAMRLPSSKLVRNWLEEYQAKHTIQINSSVSLPSLTVNFYHCAEASLSCKVGSFAVKSKTSMTMQQAFKQFQEIATPITLTENYQGYFLEQSPSSPFLSTLMWEQDNAIYIARLRTQERHTIIMMANSMAQSIPITAKTPTIKTIPPLTVNTELDHENLVRELPEDWKVKEEANLIEPTFLASRHPYFTDNWQLADNSFPEEEEDFVPILPDDLEMDESGGDFPLGIIRPIPPLELQIGSSILTNSSFSGSVPVRDTVYVNGIGLKGRPALGPTTRLTSGVGGGFVRFSGGGGYDSLTTNLGVLQELDTNMSLGLGWGYQQLYNKSSGVNDVDLSEHSVILSWNREDQLNRNLFLFSGYQLTANFAGLSEQSRINNSLGVSLGYSFTPELIGLVGYRFITDDFSNQSLRRTRSQVGGQLVYQITEDLSIAGSVSYLFGDFYDLLELQNKRVDNISFGFHIGFNVPFYFE